MDHDRLTRRRALGAAGALTLAGCSGGDGSGDGASTPSGSGGAATPTETATETEQVRISATVEGLVAPFDPAARTGEVDESAVEAAVADAVGDVDDHAVRVDATDGVVEVRARGEPSALAAGLREAGYDVDAGDVREGVRETTRTQFVTVVRDRLTAAGYDRATVAPAAAGDGIVVEVPGDERERVADLVGSRGRVELVASVPAAGDGEGDRREVTLAGHGDFAQVGEVSMGPGGTPTVEVTLTEGAATSFGEAMREYGFTDEGVGNCRWESDGEDPGHCITTVVDGEVIYAAGVAPGLAEQFRHGEFADDPTVALQTADETAAERLQAYLVAGALPAPVDLAGDA